MSWLENPLKTLSYTLQAIDGAYRGSMGIGTLKLITELIVGFAPAGPGLVEIEERAYAAIGGTIDLSKKSM